MHAESMRDAHAMRGLDQVDSLRHQCPGERQLQEKQKGSPQANQIEVLKYWHKIEFFLPYDLQRQVLEAKDAEWSVRPLSMRQLNSLTTKALWSAPVPPDRKITGFEIYLGVFDRAALAEITRRVIQGCLNASETYEQEERGGLDGLTCGASIRTDADGTLLLDELSVSTVPWALGKILQEGVNGLDFDAFRADLEALKRDMSTFRAGSGRSHAPQDPEGAPSSPADLVRLLQILSAWSGYDAAGHDAGAPVIVIRARSIEDKPRQEPSTAKAPTAAVDAASDEDEEDELPPTSETEISILNSFFAEDIARAIRALEDGSAGPALRAYLTPLPPAARQDLYEPHGYHRIRERLRPKQINRGRWPANPAHGMSLMQQFAVNSIFEQLPGPGLFSVNGPPGTGKTTLLREVFAENIVQRARVLARYATTSDAFAREGLNVSFHGEADCAISILREDLAGFEMVVASSNNAAVENISRDLPKNKSLGKATKPGDVGWRDAAGDATFGYLQPVARNLLERSKNGNYKRPPAEDEAWGLISCALGKKSNRAAFTRGISFAGPRKQEKPPKGYDRARHQSLWQWRNQYRGASFAEAKRAFLAADADVHETLLKLDSLCTLSSEMVNLTQDSYCQRVRLELEAAKRGHAQAVRTFTDQDDAWNLSQRQVELLKAEKALIEERRPGWWARLTNRRRKKAHDEELSKNRRELSEWLRKQYEAAPLREAADQEVRQTTAGVAKAETELQLRAQAWDDKVSLRDALAREFPEARQPDREEALEAEDWQIGGLWHSAQFNEKRSALFVAGLQLHEAWLSEVLKSKGGFGPNVVALCHLLNGKRLQDPRHALALWRSLFMIAPVVSSTFASFARQFRHLGPNTIGWLFVDEAGQAVPQAAVGALLRAQRAVVVGDPLQIEPVFTVPIKLLDALATSCALPQDRSVSPDKVSVQVLADDANSLGAWVGAGGTRQWIGSPLRVHRRCVEPMFSIANEIAYEGKMIYFTPQDPLARLPPPDSLDIGPSAWVDAPGATSDKQVVPGQVALVARALAALYGRTGTLPPIYLISPFKRIKRALLEQLSEPQAWIPDDASGMQPPKAGALHAWCTDRVGTVHTFQGKEESIVWLILGCDERTLGAAHWASGKPNLLNVALTRAKHRCFVIGDQALWGRLPHFAAAHAGRMPRISPQQFLRHMTQTWR
ncbi:DEAD/DEAH box helicase [Pseudorhodoferax sp.]|uniref:DEAD/DEAH box helicase n=1 Tax=Pseudorhodoferax sp. TaxID=1993553 RepID=UPI002DD6B147|nr:AAA domain-containing protein [Pseudorhodoferax sp.]